MIQIDFKERLLSIDNSNLVLSAKNNKIANIIVVQAIIFTSRKILIKSVMYKINPTIINGNDQKIINEMNFLLFLKLNISVL